MADLQVERLETRSRRLSVASSHVRYFHETDADQSATIARLLDARLVPLLDYRPRPDPGVIEVHLNDGAWHSDRPRRTDAGNESETALVSDP
jgi:hypothetical protein